MYGTNIVIYVAITINGPKGIYSSAFFVFVITINKLMIAPIKNEIKETIIILVNPKYKPSAPINFTSPNPIAFFPYTIPPKHVITKKIPAPAIIPNIIFKAIATLVIPYKKTNIRPISKIVKFILLGII